MTKPKYKIGDEVYVIECADTSNVFMRLIKISSATLWHSDFDEAYWEYSYGVFDCLEKNIYRTFKEARQVVEKIRREYDKEGDK